jgi:hypothetical protein
MGHSAIAEHVIKTSVLEACTRHGIPHDSALRQQLESEAEIPANSVGAYVATRAGLSLDARINELKTVPKFAAGLPSAAPTVECTDTAALRQNFADIASGKVVVK